MYVNITGSANNKDVYIYQSYRKENGKTSSRIYRKLGKFNDLLARFDGDKDKMMAWAKEEAAKDTAAYNEQKEKVSVEFSPTARIPLDEERNFNSGYLCLQKLCSELRIDNICRNIRNRHKFKYDLHAILHRPDLCQDPFAFKQDEQFFILPVSFGATQILLTEYLPCTFDHG